MLVELSGIWLVVLNGIAWVALHLGIAYLCCRIPTQRLDHRRWLFRTRDWERGGAVYQAILRIRKWKSLLPSGGPALGADFSLAHVDSRDRGYLQRWVLESCRAELTHWLAMASVALFLLWNPPVGVVANVVYAVTANVPCILAQRYNRPRVLAILERQADLGGAEAAASISRLGLDF
jgi:glycosyl-4,4'-diaponeurosporenoate acyltransferase